MKSLAIIQLLFFFGILNSFAQDLEDLSFGTESAFDMMTWNIEWFPKNGQTTVDNVVQIIKALDIDVVAMQEIDDKIYFDQMLDSLPQWDGFYVDDEYSNLAWLYKTNEITVNAIYEIYTTAWREFPRAPMVMEMSFKEQDFVLINNHFKCCGDGVLNISDPWDEETRRLDASILLDQYILANFPEQRVIITGDLNDLINDSPGNNIFEVFTNDAAGYLFADMDIATGSISDWSYPSWPSHLDHILLTNELFDDFDNDSSMVKTIKIDEYLPGGFAEYDQNISDHRPVALKIQADAVPLGFDVSTHDEPTIKIFPNPIITQTVISFDAVHIPSELSIYNINGQLIYSCILTERQTSVRWDGSQLPAGIYYVKITSDDKIEASSKAILTH